ncbi:MAG: hypothetical protein U9Q06_03310 [Nanoarchaeota archaeon]|nr:hypothetical protein [Nanoarchaeota archaeon]
MKRGFGLLSIILMCSVLLPLISASDIAYVYDSAWKIDDRIVNSFSDLGLSSEFIQCKNVGLIDFSDYDLIFVGNEWLSCAGEIPVSEYASVIMNGRNTKDFGLAGRRGISRGSSRAPLKSNEELFKAYTQLKYNGKYSLSIYYLSQYSDYGFNKIAESFMGDKLDLGAVVAHINSGTDLVNKKTAQENICFFGITETKYWTDETKELFKDCVEFVIGEEIEDDGEDEGEEESEGEVHDVMLDEEYADSVSGIRIENTCSEEFVVGDNLVLEMCTEYEFRVKLRNVGDFVEDVVVNGELIGSSIDSWTGTKNDFNIGSYTTTVAKHSETFCHGFSPGIYTLIYEAVLDGDANPEDNLREIEFELVAGEEWHDVAIVEDYSNSVNGLRIKDLEAGEYLLDEVAQLECNKKYKVDFKTLNVGDFTENVSFSGTLADYEWSATKLNLEVEKSTTTGSKTINMTFDEGFYELSVLAETESEDSNLENNFRSRNIEIICN